MRPGVCPAVSYTHLVTLGIEGSPYKLAVGTLQAFLDGWLLSQPQARLDYIHGEDTVRTLVAGEGAVGFLRRFGMRRVATQDGPPLSLIHI